MHRENIQKVRDHIAALPPERFNMEQFGPADERPIAGARELLIDCGTSASIAGWAKSILGLRSPHGPAAFSKKAFGLDESEAHKLFYASGSGVWRQDLTLPQAVRGLDILLETGTVDWRRAIAEAPAEAVR